MWNDIWTYWTDFQLPEKPVSGVILVHSFKQTLVKSWKCCGPLIFSSFTDFQLDPSQVIVFLWKQLRVSCWNVQQLCFLLADAAHSYQERGLLFNYWLISADVLAFYVFFFTSLSSCVQYFSVLFHVFYFGYEHEQMLHSNICWFSCENLRLFCFLLLVIFCGSYQLKWHKATTFYIIRSLFLWVRAALLSTLRYHS